jgi:hydroxyethylthiazole kinase-like uncharacterized protein yjeF
MSHPLLRVAALRAIEAQAAASLPPGTLMARAGRAAADSILAREAPRSACVLCGPGNNGGDGFVVAHELAGRGVSVDCVLIGADVPAAADARAAHARWIAAGGRVLRALPDGAHDGVVVDALVGIGLARPLAGTFLDAAAWIGRQRRVVALDVPSGLDADTGAWVGDIAGVRAGRTVTFIADKPGLHTGAGVDAAGAVTVASLDVPSAESPLALTDADDLAPLAAPRRRDSHKGSFGSVAVVGGGRGMVGAALLAARAALRMGAGRVYVDAVGAPELRVDPAQPELMFRAGSDVPTVEAVVAGCGLGDDDAARAALQAAMNCGGALVLDADALNRIALDDALRAQVRDRVAPTVLTPHPLEAARLLRCTSAEVQRDRIGAAARLAGDFGATVLLKGAGSVIAAADGRVRINPTGGPALATAGTGDVLAGMIGALLAQGFDAWSATLAAAWLHGRAGEVAGDVGLVAGDLPARAVRAWCALRQPHGLIDAK